MKLRELDTFSFKCNRSRLIVRSLFRASKRAGKPTSAKKEKQSLLSQFVEAIDFAQTRSDSDGRLLDSAKLKLGDASKKGKEREKMSREEYQYHKVCIRRALRRKVGGTARDYWKDYVQADEVKGYSSTEKTTVPGLPFLLAVIIGLIIATGVVVSQTSVKQSNDILAKQRDTPLSAITER